MSDLVSKQDVFNTLKKVGLCAMSAYLFEKIWASIEALPSAEPERKWIPCSERLPYRVEHRDDMVLVCYGNGSIRFDSCMNGEWVHGNPIAWMPLPEPTIIGDVK